MSDIRRAVFAASLDPITNGHLWVIREAARLFDEVIIAVGVNPSKKYLFSEVERVRMANAVNIHRNCRVAVMGMVYLVDFAKANNANYIVRGVRNAGDFAYELTFKNINSRMAPDIQTLFLVPPTELAEVSSSFVKGLMGYERCVEEIRKYVPEYVAMYMMAKGTPQ